MSDWNLLGLSLDCQQVPCRHEKCYEIILLELVFEIFEGGLRPQNLQERVTFQKIYAA